MYNTDFLIIGSGIAGLTFAIKVAERFPEKKIIIVTKSEAIESNTRHAQGGIATVLNNRRDDLEKHFNDTMAAGDFLNDKKTVSMVVNEAAERLKEIINWGVNFDKDEKGNYNLGLEGGHSENRIFHHKDITGYEIEKKLLKKINNSKNISLLSHHFAVDLIIKPRANNKNICIGVSLINLNNLAFETILSKVTMLATGGIGQVYSNTTNPCIATGDGIAMAYRAGATIQDMEFIQFHPTALYQPGENPSFLISEAVRGMGATLKNKTGEDFMNQYSANKSLAPRDIVSRGIAFELKKSKEECVYLDCTGIEKQKFIHHFPNIYNKCAERGIDIAKEMIPVVPAAHYLCGGIKTDEWGKTNIENLYACGESACTGLHGANRLASNSLLEALVFSHRSFLEIENSIKFIEPYKIDTPKKCSNYLMQYSSKTMDLKKNINQIMSENLGIIRDNTSMTKALTRLQSISKEISVKLKSGVFPWQLLEINNLITVAILITQSSLNRTENKGLFYSTDYISPAPVTSPDLSI